MLWANRNGFFYVLDRTNGHFLFGTPFVKVNWASGLDAKGRPIPTPQPPGQPTWPGNQGGTNWYSPSFSPSHRADLRLRVGKLRVDLPEGAGRVRARPQLRRRRRQPVSRRCPAHPASASAARTPINNWTDAVGNGTVMAIDPQTGQKKWTFQQYDVTDSGILTTASNLLFTGGREGYFYALDARTGAELWKASLGGQIVNGPITYAVDGKQYVSVISGNSLFTFGLRE